MKIFIAGGTGRVAQDLIQALTADGHQIIAGARHPEAVETSQNVRAVHLDLHASVTQIAQVVGQVDAVYFVAGSRGQDLLQTDAFGAVKLMQAVELNGIKRYIQLSSLFALKPERWSEDYLNSLTDYNIAKFFADRWLIDNTHLNYTILQPGGLTEEPGTGHIAVNVNKPGSNPIADVAKTLAESLTMKQTFKKVIMMHSGPILIADALRDSE